MPNYDLAALRLKNQRISVGRFERPEEVVQWMGALQAQDYAQALWAVGLPLLAAIAWGVFRVPNDPGNAPVAVPGPVRLLIEAAVFGGATWCLYDAGRPALAATFGVVVLLHYIAAYDRVGRMLRRRA